MKPLTGGFLVAIALTGCATEPTLVEVERVGVHEDGRTLDVVVAECIAGLKVEVNESPSRVVLSAQASPSNTEGCSDRFAVSLTESIAGRPIIDAYDGEALSQK